MGKIRMLGPRLETVKSPALAALGEIAPPRLRGRRGMERRLRILRAHPLCAECERRGRVTEAMVVDHVMPLWAGGADADHNLQSLCFACHDAKSARETDQRQRVGLDA